MSKKSELQELYASQDKAKARNNEIEMERSEIEFNLPASRLSRLRSEQLALNQVLQDLSNKISQIEGNRLKDSPEYRRLTTAIREKQDAKFNLSRNLPQGYIAARFIREDAVENGNQQIANLEKELSDLLSRMPTWPRYPGPRFLEERHRLEGLIAAAEKERKSWEFGAKMAKLRREQSELEAELRELELSLAERPELAAV
jgi:chromosome segregation ATPase